MRVYAMPPFVLRQGMIGTEPIMRDAGNHRLAITVDQCIAEMVCAVQARWDRTLVPKWYGPLTAPLPWLPTWAVEALLNEAYVLNVAGNVARIAAAARGLAAAAAATAASVVGSAA